MSEREKVTEQLARLINQHPDLPVRVGVSSDLYDGENKNYDVGVIAWCMVDDEYWGKEYVHYKSNADYEGTLEDACNKGDIPYKPETIYSGNVSDEELEKLYEGLPWKECIVVYVE